MAVRFVGVEEEMAKKEDLATLEKVEQGVKKYRRALRRGTLSESRYPKVVALLKELDAAYYGKEGKAKVSDEEYDRLREAFKSADPKNDYFLGVGSPITSGEKVTLPVKMGSLVKVTPEKFPEWASSLPKGTWISFFPKLDGLAGILHYRNRRLVSVMTRGDGKIGRVVTDNAKHVQGVRRKLKTNPFQTDRDIYIKGEFIIHNKLFDKYHKGEEYKNPRNFCVGMINRKELDDKTIAGLQNMTFVCYGMEMLRTNGRTKVPEIKGQELLYLHYAGMTVIDNPTRYRRGHYELLKTKKKVPSLKSVLPILMPPKPRIRTEEPKKVTPEYLKGLIDQFKEEWDILQDGVVAVIEQRNFAKEIGYEADGMTPGWARAIKLDVSEQESRIGRIDHVEWGFTKRRLYKPVVILKKPLDFNGVEVSNPTGVSYAYVRENKWYPGAKIKVIRSGDVIPRITETIERGSRCDAPSKCYYCGTKLKVNENDLYCPNDDCTGGATKLLQSFFGIVEVDGIKDSTILKLIETGYDTVPKLLNVRTKDLANIEGFGEKKAKMVTDGLNDCLRDVKLATIMHASGMFHTEQASMGESLLQRLVDHFGTREILKLEKSSRLRTEVIGIKDMGPTRADLFLAGIRDFQEFYRGIENSVSLKDNKKVKLSSTKLAGMGFGFTGFRDEDLNELIQKNGGIITNGVTTKTTHLFAKQMGTTKANKAVEKGLKVVGSADAWDYIKRKIK